MLEFTLKLLQMLQIDEASVLRNRFSRTQCSTIGDTISQVFIPLYREPQYLTTRLTVLRWLFESISWQTAKLETRIKW